VSSAPDLPPAIAIREGGLGDLDQVMAVMASAFDPGFGERWTRSQCAGILPMTGVALRLTGDPVEGFALMRVVADEAELLLIAVAPAAQQQGIGQALLDDFVDRAREKGGDRLHLEVRASNPAIELYRANGFVPAGRRRDYYRGPNGELHDAITLVRAEQI